MNSSDKSKQTFLEYSGFKTWKGIGITASGGIFSLWFLFGTDIFNVKSKKFMSYFQQTFESVMYDGCVSEGKHLKKVCSCFSKELNKILPDDGKKLF